MVVFTSGAILIGFAAYPKHSAPTPEPTKQTLEVRKGSSSTVVLIDPTKNIIVRIDGDKVEVDNAVR